MTTTGDTSTDALVVLGVCAVLLLALVALTWPLEHNDRAGRWADRLLVALFGDGGEWE